MLSLLRCPGDWLIFRIHVDFRDASLWPGMVGRCVPRTFEQLYPTEFLQRNTVPICR